ncbi:metallophosphoesterase [Candidatus Woesearchaeota archaeon]|nr:metallophosphoesterase [Candidatus Woesearchaeota archaeon]MCF8013080.1 metallophosphoesterase [Candidatus Woesearchaeota archaeon]
MSSSTILNSLIEKGILVSPDIMEKEVDEEILNKIIELEGDSLDLIDEALINKYSKLKEDNHNVHVIRSYDKKSKKRSFQDFVGVMNNRYNITASILRNRQEMMGVTSISRMMEKDAENQTAIIGMVLEKNLTKNENYILKLEDKTGICVVIVKKDEKNKELYNIADDISLDEVIGVIGKKFNDAIFAQKIVFPDIPPTKELKKQAKEEYVAILGDIHFGSNVFMKEEFDKFILWINGESGSLEQRELAKKVKYIIHTGDIIEGVGVYPSQEDDLDIIDIKKQYEYAAKYFKKIPKDKKIIMISGNHDAGRLAEPQEPVPKDLAEELYTIPNLFILSNPAYVNIASTEDFSGFDCLIYHGGSLIYYSENIPSIRSAGGQKRSDLIMQYLLQRRHLAPTHGSTLYIPDPERDPLIIDIVPDFFITGHIHRAAAKNYRNITMINGSCWTETTDDQIKRGLEPQPARLPLINLKTRAVKMMNFMSQEAKEKEAELLKEIKEAKAKAEAEQKKIEEENEKKKKLEEENIKEESEKKNIDNNSEDFKK